MQTVTDKPYFDIYYLSERAVTVEFGNAISVQLLQQISRFNNLLNARPFAGYCTSVQAYTTLTVFYNPVDVIKTDILGMECFAKVSNYLLSLEDTHQAKTNISGQTITIPVCYGGTFGPDLDELAALHKLPSDMVIKLHTSVIYTVYMIGFVPGFAYLGGLPEVLATPRKLAPRKAVPAGAVGIAGAQTGVYPLQTPGGWQIIGQTPLKMFDANWQQPSLLKAGDQVVFKAINSDEFNALAQ
jgi:inhibitor of KinA